MSHITVKDLPVSERPYERFRELGAEALSDAELLAIILRSGTKDMTALELARQLLSECQGNLLNLYEFSYEELVQRRGIGPVKAIQLKAIAELSNRITKTNSSYQMQYDNPESIALCYMEVLRHRREEVFMVLFFDAKYHFIGDSIITVGGRNCNYVSPAEVFSKALIKNAIHVVLLHNHPSGDPFPSEADRLLTQRMVEAAKLLGIGVTDHIIIGDNRYYSFCENLIMPTT